MQHEQEPTGERSATNRRSMEMVVALLLLLLGSVVVFDSLRLGASWADDGPQAGYFPFHIGVILCATSLYTLAGALRMRSDVSFVSTRALRLVLTVLIPTVVYVAAIQWLGLYVSSSLFIAAFMWRLGRYRIPLVAAVSLGVSGALFAMFEIWFTLPLPKGPIEAALGFG
ncbi:MAG: tripartite tricarboxylate transporter TctB family protein [Betaproteobacteria bacterium]